MRAVCAGRARQLAGAAIVVLAAVCVPSRGAPSIAGLAPPEVEVVISIDNWAEARAGFEKSGVGRALASPEMGALGTAMLAEPPRRTMARDRTRLVSLAWQMMHQEVRPARDLLWGLLEDAGVKREEIPAPTGHVGLATLDAEAGQPPAGVEPLPRPANGLLLYGEYGDNAEAISGLLTRGLAELERRGRVTLREEEIGGAKVRVVRLTDLDTWLKERAVETPIIARWAARDTWYVHRAGTGFVAATTRLGMESAIARLAGHGESAAGLPEYKAAVARHPEMARVHATWLLAPMRRQLEAGQKALRESALGRFFDFAGVPSMDSMLAATGYKGTQAISATASFDEDGGLTTTMHVVTPRIGGFVAALRPMDGPLEAPPFAAMDAMSVGQMRFSADRVVTAMREFTASSLPSFPGSDKAAMQQQMDAMFAPVLEAVGPEVSISETLIQPLTPGAVPTLGAVRLRDPIPVQNLITLFGDGQAKPRTVEGGQIYEFPQAAGEEALAVGIGKDWLFGGTPPVVEQAMRQAARAEGGLAANPAFTKAAATFKPGSIAAVWVDTRQYVRWLNLELGNPPVDAREAMAARRRGREPKRPEPPAWVGALPSPEWWAGYVGDVTFQLHAVDGGLDFVVRWMAP